MAHSTKNLDIHDEENYDPTLWVPKAHSHGTKALIKVFWILLAITILDVILYFMMPIGTARNVIFIGLGVVKAAFIVYEFMHMRYEKQFLQRTIVWPMVFVIYLIVFLLVEADFLHGLIWE